MLFITVEVDNRHNLFVLLFRRNNEILLIFVFPNRWNEMQGMREQNGSGLSSLTIRIEWMLITLCMLFNVHVVHFALNFANFHTNKHVLKTTCYLLPISKHTPTIASFFFFCLWKEIQLKFKTNN